MTVNEYWGIGDDAHVYYDAATRLLTGGTLYDGSGPLIETYLYGPWLAFAFVPLTALPREAVMVGMSLVCLAAAGAVLWPLRRPSYETLALLLLIGPPLIHSAWLGNVQALMVAAVMYLPGRGAWIGLAASLKGAPLAMAFAEDRRTMAIALIVTAVGLLPMLLFDLSEYPSGESLVGLWAISPVLSGVVFCLGAVAAHRLKSRTVAAGTVILAAPYLLLSYLAWLMVGVRDDATRDERGASTRRRGISSNSMIQ